MFRNYFIISWRNLVKNKVYSFINITGLAIGLAVCMLIVLYVGHEYSYDKFHENGNRIFYVKSKIKIGNDSLYMTEMPFSTAPLVAQHEPSIEAFLRLRQERQTIIQSSQLPSAKFSEDQFYFADHNFFDFFSFKLLSGSKEKSLNDPYAVVISEQAAQKYFGKEDPIGKILRFNNEHNLVVTGVAAKAPSNSTIQFDFVASIGSIVSMVAKDSVDIEEKRVLTYFLAKHPDDIAKIEASLLSLEKTKNKLVGRIIGTPLTDIRQQEGSDTSNTKYLKIFPFVAALVLLLALINYISLSTARSTTRAKEIGVRKVLGAGREMIAGQFFTESILYTSIAFIIGYILCTVAQPFFFNFLQIHVDSSFLWNKYILMSFTGLFIISGILAATYPSILLSAYKPVAVLYGKMNKHGKGISVRKFFTVFQFSAAVVLIVCGIVISRQIDFFRNTDTGVNRENIVMIPFTKEVAKHYDAFKKDIGSLTGAGQISTALHPLYKGFDMMGTIPPGKAGKTRDIVFLPTLSVDQHFIQMLGLKWKVKPADPLFYHNENAAILNETAIEKLGLDRDPVNKKMDDELVVAGILKDFNYASLQNKIDGLCVFVTQDNDTTSLWARNGGCLFISIHPQTNTRGFITAAKAAYEKYDPETPFSYHFLDDAYDAMYNAENRLVRILGAFTAFIIFIACLGLFGLAAFMVVRRTKEVGIRKVLGASAGQLSLMLSKDFVRLVIVSIVIASPIAWWIMNKWLEDFVYRINISWWMFVLAGVGALVVALLTVSLQAIKAAIANPVKSLRTE